MEKICEFCAALRPIVFCKADSAFLCLSCDAKVHSANALSNRHFRCLLCESCREQLAYIRCLDHRMLLCRACDGSLHERNAKLNQHQRRMVSSFTGSPSAKQFAALWGFDATQLALEDQLAGPSTSSISAGSVVSADFSVGSNHPEQIPGKEQQQSFLIMQQIVDLNRLQLNEVSNQSLAIRERGKSHSSSSCVYNTLGKIDECLEDATRDSSGPVDDFQGLKEHHFPSPLSQSEYLSSYTSTEPFWQSRTALESKQFWPQNLEELRVSEELHCFDDFKMPEVDLTFPNFEELLREDQDLSRALLEDNSTAFFCSEKDPSANKSENSYLQSAHVKGVSVSSSIRMEETNHEEKRAHFSLQDCQTSRGLESPTMIRPSYSYSYSFSHLSAESSGSDCHDSGHSGNLARTEPTELVQGLKMKGHESALVGRFKDRKKSRLQGMKQTQLSPRKSKADPSKRLKGLVLKLEEERCLSIKSSRSC